MGIYLQGITPPPPHRRRRSPDRRLCPPLCRPTPRDQIAAPRRYRPTDDALAAKEASWKRRAQREARSRDADVARLKRERTALLRLLREHERVKLASAARRTAPDRGGGDRLADLQALALGLLSDDDADAAAGASDASSPPDSSDDGSSAEEAEAAARRPARRPPPRAL